MKKILLFLGYMAAFALQAQNLWLPIGKTQELNFQAQDSNHITNCLYVDSAQVENGDSIFIFNKIAKQVNNSPNYPVYWRDQGQFLYRKMRKKSSGLYVFEDTVKKFALHTQANIGDSWVFDSLQNITAQVITTTWENHFGQNDSVKTILLSNNDTIRLTQHHGLLQFPRYRLVGIQHTTLGEQFTGFAEIYSFQVGDIFQYKSYASSSSAQAYRNTYTKRKVLSRKDSAGGFVYHYEEWKKDSIVNYGQNTVSINYYHTFPVELLLPNLLDGNLEDAYPLEIKSLAGSYIGVNEVMRDSDGFLTKSFYNTSDENANPYPYFTPSVGSLFMIRKQWKESLGKTYTYNYGSSNLSYEQLIGHIRNGAQHGTVRPDSIYTVGIASNLSPLAVKVFPNPCSEQLTISLPNSQSVQIKIQNLLGQTLEQHQFQHQQEITLATQHLSGLYLLKIETKSETFVTKIAIE